MPQTTEGLGAPVGYQQITNLATAVGLTIPAATSPATAGIVGNTSGTGGASSVGRARYALIQAEGANVRWRDDGVAPTASVGFRLLQDDSFVYTGDLSAIQFIQETAGGKLSVSYLR
jgi:hypothetical protein